MRIEAALSASELSAVFDPSGTKQLFHVIGRWLTSDRYTVLRISLAHVPFAQDAREVVVNAMGRDLLRRAREGAFGGHPLLVVLDEAHNFLARQLWEEQDPYPLDAFELIAKEGRKYEVVLCVATQRARDLPEGVVSQIGTFLLHRVANDRDRELLERSGSDLDRDTLSALPLLVPGEMVGMGVGFPIPLRVQVGRPAAPPDSAGPSFSSRGRREEHPPDHLEAANGGSL
jgi:DNA helicase HerA-like ATPase